MHGFIAHEDSERRKHDVDFVLFVVFLFWGLRLGREAGFLIQARPLGEPHVFGELLDQLGFKQADRLFFANELIHEFVVLILIFGREKHGTGRAARA